MTLDKFEYVLAIAEEKSITKAAKRLYITQPGLTAYINKLEQYLGIKLFDRTVNPIQVTEAGMLYISKMKELQKEETLLRLMLHDMGSSKRIFRIGMGMTRGMRWLPILLPAFQHMHPDVVLQIQEGGLQNLEDGINDNNLDVAFGAFSTGYLGITYEIIRKEIIYCVIPRTAPCVSHFAKDEATIFEPALIESKLLSSLHLLMPMPSNGFYQFTNQILLQHHITPIETLTLSNLDTAYRLAANGYGALFINAFDFHQTHPSLDDKLAFCTLTKPLIQRNSMLCYKECNSNFDLIQSLKSIINNDLLPVLDNNVPFIQNF